MVIHLIYDHNGHVCLWVQVAIEMSCHGRKFSPPVQDIWAMIVHSAMKGSPCFTHMLLATPPACKKIYHTVGPAGGPHHNLELLFVANSIGQVLHLQSVAAPHDWLPGSSCDVDIKNARTNRSFRFFGRWKAMRGGVENAFCNRSETWRIDRCCLVVKRKEAVGNELNV